MEQKQLTQQHNYFFSQRGTHALLSQPANLVQMPVPGFSFTQSPEVVMKLNWIQMQLKLKETPDEKFIGSVGGEGLTPYTYPSVLVD